jgi:GNAT superfamily N-acetyltransferase
MTFSDCFNKNIFVSMGYHIERVSAGKLSDLVLLFRDAFNWKTNVDFLSFRYDTTRLGPRDLGYLAYSDENEPAAYYGVFAAKLSINGLVIQGAQSGDTATHSRHRGKGLFTDLARATYELAAREGVQVIFGFPNKNSYPGFVKKLDWKHTHDIDVYKIKVLTLPLAQAARKYAWMKGFFNWWVSMFVKSKTTSHLLESSITSAGQNGVIHDAAYYAYKQSDNKYLIKYNGIRMWLKFDGFLWVGDMELNDIATFRNSMKLLKGLAFRTGCDKIVFHASPGTKLHTMLSADYSKSSVMPAAGLNLDGGDSITSLKFIGADFDSW